MDGDPFDLVGDVLDGQFRVDEFAGEGDLSVVYRGHHIGVDATVAIKCLNLPATLDPALVRPLVESFREASRLHYRLARGNMNIAQSIAAGQTIAPRTGATVPYLVREWLEGESLASDLERRRIECKRGRTVEQTIALMETALDGMAYAHRHDVVHLSFSPANLFFARQDEVWSLKVLDFGVARALNEIESDLPHDSRPQEGLRVLFPSYAAPEQLDKSVGEVGPPTDVYAIALVVMEVLSDRIVMGGYEAGPLVDRALHELKRPTPESHGLHLPPNLEVVLARAVARAPARRQKDAASFWKDVKSAARGTTSRSLPASRAPSPTLTGMPPASASLPPPLPSVRAPAPSFAPSPPLSPSPPPSFAPSFAPSPAPSPAPSLSLAPAPAPAPAQIITEPLPPPMPVALPPLALPLAPATPFPIVTPNPLPKMDAYPELATALPADRLTPTFIAVTASVTGLLLVCLVILLVTWPRGHGASAAPVASSPPSPVTSWAAPVASPSAREPPPPAAPPSPTGRFPAFAAARALDGTTRKLGSCRRGSTWGVAKATVTFANDGSVDHVVIGPPFTATPTGECVAEAMSAARIPPFGGPPAVFIAQFFVPAR